MHAHTSKHIKLIIVQLIVNENNFTINNCNKLAINLKYNYCFYMLAHQGGSTFSIIWYCRPKIESIRSSVTLSRGERNMKSQKSEDSSSSQFPVRFVLIGSIILFSFHFRFGFLFLFHACENMNMVA